MACACGGKSARSAAGAQQNAQQNGGNPYVFEVTYNDGSRGEFNTEPEALRALSFKGGGYRRVAR